MFKSGDIIINKALSIYGYKNYDDIPRKHKGFVRLVIAKLHVPAGFVQSDLLVNYVGKKALHDWFALSGNYVLLSNGNIDYSEGF